MRLPATQDLSDGELLYIIEPGVRLTGMPGWSTGTAHLPRLTADELEGMEELNPRSPVEIREEIKAEEFLKGANQ